MERQIETKPATVSEKTQQAGEVHQRYWGWAKRSVWTDAMLGALTNGVKGGKWFRLIDKVWKKENLHEAWEGVRKNDGAAGVDRQSVQAFEENAAKELEQLHQQLHQRKYQPKPAMRVWIDKPGSTDKRPLGIPVVRDRVVQGALRNVIEPIFDRDFSENSYGFRPWRGAQEALAKVEDLLNQGYLWIVDADIKGYFDNIPQERLMGRVAEKIADGRVLELIEMFLKAGVMEEGKGWKPTERGTPQGGVISPLLANIYLDPLDRLMEKQGVAMVRYADDFVLLCRTEEEARKALDKVRLWMEENGLTLHPEKTRIVNATQPGGFDFLGYHFEQGKKWVRKKSMDSIKNAIREITKRTTGNSMKTIIEQINPRLKGWYAYFSKSLPTCFDTVDGYTRRRLRAILLKRKGTPGHGNKSANRKWQNAYFENQGLFSLLRAHEMKPQSP